VENMSVKEQVLDIIKASPNPLSAGEVEKLSGLERKAIDKAFTELKKENAIVSPIRCKWEAAAK
jgi:predicted transcriptional regulator